MGISINCTCSSFKPSNLTNFRAQPQSQTQTPLRPKFSTGVNFNNASTTFKHPKTVLAATAEALATETPLDYEKLGVVVKPMFKPRLVLKFIWMEKNIGLALDQVIPGYGTIPVSPYYFWPRKDAWEELKTMLESKPWISQKQVIILLNQATDIINLWQQSGADTQ
ncbi:small ribosomal subunit protein cS23-like [Rutidosis leptorrhynchoides]|uniref:small ribosomal subunit protein cS23-like n=1 Tax=Rutidosis leptorrhynchoides TaxID=125765 RepID=UPI003A99B16F